MAASLSSSTIRPPSLPRLLAAIPTDKPRLSYLAARPSRVDYALCASSLLCRGLQPAPRPSDPLHTEASVHLLLPSTLHHASAIHEIAKTETSLNRSISFGSPSTAPSAKYIYG